MQHSNPEPILVIMAAGMGSRYGGLKQMDPIGPCGEVILHYSIFDALRAGFKRVVFLIKHEIEADFRSMVGDPVARHMEVRYAFQQLDKVPEGFTVPDGRVKPWGTGHAVLCCKDYIDAPFCVINADDYYGPSAFQSAYETLSEARDDDRRRYMMVGYLLKNTVTRNGHVARGLCDVSADGYLQRVTETTHIISCCDGILKTEDGQTYTRLSEDTLVSMNMWGFTPSLITALEDAFPKFLTDDVPKNPLKAEFFLPTVVSQMLSQGLATVRVLPSLDKWYGVTYREDKPDVMLAITGMTNLGKYPRPLFA